MLRDQPITFPFGSPGNPDQDRDASFLWVRYSIGDDHDPDEVIEVKGHGDFRIDRTLRDEIRAVPPQAPDDDDVRETQIHPMGVAEPYLIDVWLLAQSLPSNVIGSAIWDGCKALWRKAPRRAPRTDSSRTDSAAATYALPPQQQLISDAKAVMAEHYTIRGELTEVSVNLSESSSGLKFSGTALLSADDGRTFEVSIDYDNDGLRQSRIVRKHPEP